MSTNGSFGTNTTNAPSTYRINISIADIINISCYIDIFIIIVGTLLNLWFLVAILSSQDTRSRLRNKIICNSFVLHLVDSVVKFPVNVYTILKLRFTACIFDSVISHLAFIQDFIGNWLLVMLLVIFIAQIQDFNPRMKLSPKTITLGTVGLLVFPWAMSLVLVPVIIHEYHKRSSYPKDCTFPTLDSKEVLKSVDTAVPIFMSVLLLIVAGLLRYRRFTRGYSSRYTQTELISRGPEIDNSIAYIVATAVCFSCDILELVFALNNRAFLNYGLKIWITMKCVSIIMSSSRVILMVLTWLLLPDIRQRIRIWRPWYRHAGGIDWTVAYKKEEI